MSHAWCRTIDGVQGGTWDQVHLLATPALDRYPGYVGQSRAVAPTHTWNTTSRPLDEGDHGGRLVQEPRSTPDEQIAAALARAQPKTFAADRDPYRIEADLRAEQDHHRTHLKQRPPDLTERITQAEATVQARGRDLADWEGRLAHWHQQQSATSGLRGLTRSRRQAHHQAAHHVDTMTPHLEQARHHLDQALAERGQLVDEQSRRQQFDAANQWRAERISQLDARSPNTGPMPSSTPPETATPPPTAPNTFKPPAPTSPPKLSPKTTRRYPGRWQICNSSITLCMTWPSNEPATSATGAGPQPSGVHHPVEHAAYPELAPARSGPELTI